LRVAGKGMQTKFCWFWRVDYRVIPPLQKKGTFPLRRQEKGWLNVDKEKDE